jgi:hypothetical protein
VAPEKSLEPLWTSLMGGQSRGKVAWAKWRPKSQSP